MKRLSLVSTSLFLTTLATGCALSEVGPDEPAPAQGEASPDVVPLEADGAEGSGYALLAGTWQPVSYDVVDGVRLMDGDMALGEVRTKPPGSARGAPDKSHRWPNARVVYQLDSGLNAAQKQIVTDAISLWQTNTPFRFVARSNESDYVLITQHPLNDIADFTTCHSEVGRRGGKQELVMNSCDMPAVAHEMGHAIGMFHEQSRPDRDQYVTIQWGNIEEIRKKNFDIKGDALAWGPYNYTSLMHYRRNQFALNEALPTITRKDGGSALWGATLNNLDRATAWFLADTNLVTKGWHNLYSMTVGWPLDGEIDAGNGRRILPCERGDIHVDAAGNPYLVQDPVRFAYNVTGGMARFGGATSWRQPLANGVEVQRFERGSVYVVNGSAFAVRSDLATVYEQRQGGPSGWMGVPRSSERQEPGGGASFDTDLGTMYTKNGMTNEVHGDIRTKMNALGGVARTGYPTTDEWAASGAGRFNHFENGSIYWNGSIAKTFFVSGATRDRWAAQGWDGGALGFPDSDVGRSANNRGTWAHFQGGSIMHRDGTPAAFIVKGRIRDTFWAEGNENGYLGFPLGEQYCASACAFVHRTLRQDFEGGWIDYNPAGDWVAATRR